MGYALTVPPQTEPLEYLPAKRHLRLSGDDEREDVEALIRVARRAVEDRTRRALVSQTWALELDRFPACGVIELPRAPLSSVTSIVYTDTDGDSQTLATSQYDADAKTLPPVVRRAYNVSWPATRRRFDAVTVTYVAGYGDREDVPAPLVHAIKLLVGTLWENRESVLVGTITAKIPDTLDALLEPYRIPEPE